MTRPASAEGVRDREADRRRFPDEHFNRWLDEGISDAGHTVWCSINEIADAWAAWDSRPHYEECNCLSLMHDGTGPEHLADCPATPAVAQPQPESDGMCKDADGCPTELAVLQRFWRVYSGRLPMPDTTPPESSEQAQGAMQALADQAQALGMGYGEFVLVPRDTVGSAMQQLYTASNGRENIFAKTAHEFRDLLATAGATKPSGAQPQNDGEAKLFALSNVLDRYEAQTKALPGQHEIPERGCSTYNWRMSVIRDLRAMLAATQPAADRGMVMVPRGPSVAIIKAMCNSDYWPWLTKDEARQIYATMLASSAGEK